MEPQIGVALWNMRSTASRPAAFESLYRQAIDDARLVEELGFDSIWFGEHRFWYDGWCPQPVLVAAAAAAATKRLHVGTSIHLLGQHDPTRAALVIATADALSSNRLELGVGLGYRPEEYEGLGLRFEDRVKHLERGLDALGSSPRRVWYGGVAKPAIRRAARRGLSLLLPPGMSDDKVREMVALARSEAQAAGKQMPRVAMIKEIWVDSDAGRAESYHRERFGRQHQEYVVAWWRVRDEQGNLRPDRVVRQVERNLSSGVTGRPEEVAVALLKVVDAGVDTLILQVYSEETQDRYRRQLRMLSATLLPLLRGVRVR
jgi:alkanesulfonate monooxygenase SsuD/methylene tetrahydromethanopterin reductase-like flavin-dependent oxidoreductase (luciferase family)